MGPSRPVFAVLAAWLLLGQRPAVTQLAGGILILAGITAVHAETPPPARHPPGPVISPALPSGRPRPAARS